jgi:hypothetical protein
MNTKKGGERGENKSLNFIFYTHIFSFKLGWISEGIGKKLT